MVRHRRGPAPRRAGRVQQGRHEVWFSVWNAKDQESAIVVVDDKTLQLKKRDQGQAAGHADRQVQRLQHAQATSTERRTLDGRRARRPMRPSRQRQRRKARAMRPGRVYLVGAGPGDPDLLTLKAARVTAAGRRRRLRPSGRPTSILDLVPPGARRIDVGKAAEPASRVPQDEINAAAGRARPRRPARGPPEGRRSLRLRPRRRGGARTFAATASRSRSCPASPRRWAAPRLRRPADPSRAGDAVVRYRHRSLPRTTLLLDLRLAGPGRSATTTLVVYMGLANIGEIAERLIGARPAAGDAGRGCVTMARAPTSSACATSLARSPRRACAEAAGLGARCCSSSARSST